MKEANYRFSPKLYIMRAGPMYLLIWWGATVLTIALQYLIKDWIFPVSGAIWFALGSTFLLAGMLMILKGVNLTNSALTADGHTVTIEIVFTNHEHGEPEEEFVIYKAEKVTGCHKSLFGLKVYGDCSRTNIAGNYRKEKKLKHLSVPGYYMPLDKLKEMFPEV